MSGTVHFELSVSFQTVNEFLLITCVETMDKRSKITRFRSPAPAPIKAFGSFFPLLSPCSSSSCCRSSCDDEVRVAVPEIGVKMKKRQFRSPRKDRDEHRGQIRDVSSKTCEIRQTNSVIGKDANNEVKVSRDWGSILLDIKGKAEEDGFGRIHALRRVSSSCSALPNLRTDPVAAQKTQETNKNTKASLEDSAAVISPRLKSILKRTSNGQNHTGGTESVKQASFRGLACNKGFHEAKNIENAAKKHVTFYKTCKDDSNWTPKNHQGWKFTAKRNIRRKKMQKSSETLAALSQLARLITDMEQGKK